MAQKKKEEKRRLNGLIVVHGEPDTGKTWFAISCGTPLEKIAFFDNDFKTKQSFDSGELPFGRYIDLVEAHSGKTELPFYDFCMDQIDKIDDKEFETVIWDNWTPFEDTFHPKVMENPSKFRKVWANLGAIKGAQQWQASFQLESEILDHLQSKVPQIFITTHVKPLVLNNVRTDKMVAACKRSLLKMANFRIWLRMNEKGTGVPIGLILKRLAKPVIDTDGSASIVNVLPRRMEQCTWDEIWRYWDNPVGERKLEPSEIPNEHELAILDGTLSPDQKEAYRLTLKYGQIGVEEELTELIPEKDEELIAKVKELADKPPAMIAKELEVEVAIVLAILSEEGVGV